MESLAGSEGLNQGFRTQSLISLPLGSYLNQSPHPGGWNTMNGQVSVISSVLEPRTRSSAPNEPQDQMYEGRGSPKENQGVVI